MDYNQSITVPQKTVFFEIFEAGCYEDGGYYNDDIEYCSLSLVYDQVLN